MDTADIIEALHESVDDCPRCMVCDTQDDAMRAAIETALAEREQQVRAKVAEELHNAYGWSDSSDRHFAVAVVNGGLARGEPAPAQTTAAHTPGTAERADG